MKEISPEYIRTELKKYGLGISSWSPGDGWRRYKVVRFEGHGERDMTMNMDFKELRAWFNGFMFGKGRESYI